MDVEPSGNASNPLSPLEVENGTPRPLINSGAIVVSDILCRKLKSPKKELLKFIRKVANSSSIDYCPHIVKSEKETGFRNYVRATYLKFFDNIENDINEVIEPYFDLCYITMTCIELSIAFGNLRINGKPFLTQNQIL